MESNIRQLALLIWVSITVGFIAVGKFFLGVSWVEAFVVSCQVFGVIAWVFMAWVIMFGKVVV